MLKGFIGTTYEDKLTDYLQQHVFKKEDIFRVCKIFKGYSNAIYENKLTEYLQELVFKKGDISVSKFKNITYTQRKITSNQHMKFELVTE